MSAGDRHPLRAVGRAHCLAAAAAERAEHELGPIDVWIIVAKNNILALVVFGSIVIMANLDANMMPMNAVM